MPDDVEPETQQNATSKSCHLIKVRMDVKPHTLRWRIELVCGAHGRASGLKPKCVCACVREREKERGLCARVNHPDARGHPGSLCVRVRESGACVLG